MKKEEVQPRYILIQSEQTLSFDEDQCYINDNPVEPDSNAKLGAKEMCYQKQKLFYDSFLKKHFKSVVVLTAAGTSLDNGGPTNSGKTRDGLWTFCQTEIDALTDSVKDLKKKDFYSKKDIEAFLSYVILYEKINGVIEKGEAVLREALEVKIADACKLKLQPQAPHVDFLNKITARKANDPRVQLFTTNYDLLFEMAANQSGFIVVDGFSFTHPRKFSGRYFDFDIVNREKTRVKQEDSFVSKVFHLYKLHGSLNWYKDDANNIIQQDEPTKPLIIYPANEKYESSYEQPYFEMMSRFQQALRKENTLLIVIGFGFQDKHIQNVIIEAVEQNPNFQLLIVNYSGKEDGGINTAALKAFFVDESTKHIKRNVTIVYDSFSSFTKKYPTNNTYIEPSKDINNESF